MGGCVSIAAQRMQNGNTSISIINTRLIVMRHSLSLSGWKTKGFVG